MDVKDVVERAAWTFVQTFIGVLTASALLDFDISVIAAGAAAAVADALVVVKEFAKSRLEA
jgi:hypothetical protein